MSFSAHMECMAHTIMVQTELCLKVYLTCKFEAMYLARLKTLDGVTSSDEPTHAVTSASPILMYTVS